MNISEKLTEQYNYSEEILAVGWKTGAFPGYNVVFSLLATKLSAALRPTEMSTRWGSTECSPSEGVMQQIIR
jgi:hypothetical protein